MGQGVGAQPLSPRRRSLALRVLPQHPSLPAPCDPAKDLDGWGVQARLV